ncbi:MAG: hypothetical protein UT58_C0017G0009 [Microgenomates group bacterium GW2011_GWC1_39_7b]|uniref:Uncharacterized protein n=2 Tax=Candidatus Woeseibacteriota TaxID=1752722 RepID=A0A0G0UYC4_9BACT|nr:MAG: hypothetical protein UT17_C0002G0108 [Candidatus Woesebacteria bacterium GW2011_GWB1_39_10]KKR26255.1 MAG: hypothetical protein UT58_C0017G0009 [Microgenomates group bacterium GW2011_GWC1_39_7b]KKR92541.1 MAG: hypothetical protein UU42_C0001G0145 [Candidatus Woesebacteria bacterium GW2011_GWA1_41_13b]
MQLQDLDMVRPLGTVQEIWYKAYAPAGYNPVKITSDLQTKPSIVSLSYTGTYKNLKLAHSLDGKSWGKTYQVYQHQVQVQVK